MPSFSASFAAACAILIPSQNLSRSTSSEVERGALCGAGAEALLVVADLCDLDLCSASRRSTKTVRPLLHSSSFTWGSRCRSLPSPRRAVRPLRLLRCSRCCSRAPRDRRSARSAVSCSSRHPRAINRTSCQDYPPPKMTSLKQAGSPLHLQENERAQASSSWPRTAKKAKAAAKTGKWLQTDINPTTYPTPDLAHC